MFDSGMGDDARIIVLSTDKMLSLFRENYSWLLTFKIDLSIFVSYIRFMLKKKESISMWYALIANKSELSYGRLFKNLLGFEPELNPAAIMVDFEKAAINALEEIFIAVCFFHLSQNIYKKIQSVGLKLADQTRKIPNYPIRIWNLYARMSTRLGLQEWTTQLRDDTMQWNQVFPHFTHH